MQFKTVAKAKHRSLRGALRVGLGAAAVLLTSCEGYESHRAAALPRERPNDWGLVRTPLSCQTSATDDVCLRCEKESCCAEIDTCDSNCRILYAQYQECLYPSGGAWSGFGSEACKERLPASEPARTRVIALIDCAGAACSTEETCGVEPRAVFTYPPPAPASDFSAAGFFESYCTGCHFQGFLGPTGIPTSALSRDQAWWGPYSNYAWFEYMDYPLTVEKSPAIRCGVTKDYFPTECVSLSTVPAGFFTGPAKFPPSGHGMYSGAANPCRFAPDGMTCPQPTDFERARLLSWLADGAPR